MKKSISYWSFSGKNVFQAMQTAKDAGFDGIELTLDAEGDVTMQTTAAQLAEIRSAAQALGLALPSVASSLFWAYSFTSDDPDEREQAHQAAVCEIQTAKALGADTVLVVPGSVSVEFVPERPVVAYDVCWERSLQEMKRLAPIAEEAGINIGIENVWNRFLLSPLEMRQFLDEIGSERVGAYFDVGNVVYSGYPEQWIRILGKRIKKVHFKDFRRNPGGLNSFVDLLSGDVDWQAVMQEFADIGYDDWVTGEMIPPYTHASDQIIYNTSASIGRILKKEF